MGLKREGLGFKKWKCKGEKKRREEKRRVGKGKGKGKRELG